MLGELRIRKTGIVSFGDSGDVTISRVTTNVLALGDGDVWGRVIANTTLGAGATTFAVASEIMIITGDGGGNTIATITGGTEGMILILLFVDANITITDTDAHTANTVDLAGTATDLTSADDTVLTLFFDGTSWYEISRSVN